MREQEEMETRDVAEESESPPEETGDEAPREISGEPVGGVVDSGPETDPLADAIQENPEEVAGLIRRAGLVNDLLDATEVATSAMNDRMVQELAGTSTNLLSAADAAATEEVVHVGAAVGENGEEVGEAIETLARLQRTGTLDELVQIADVLSLATDALDDGMVTRLAATGSNLGGLADAAADEDAARALERLLDALGETEAADTEKVGPVGLVRATRDPEVQAGLGYLIAFARAFGRVHVDE